MKTKDIILFLFFTISITACKDDNKIKILPLEFRETNYTVKAGFDYFIYVKSGNKDYTLEVANPELVDFVNMFSYNEGYGSLVIRAKQKGETQLTVTDNVSKEQKDLTIKIVDAYLGFTVTETFHPFFPANSSLILVKDASRTFYLCEGTQQAKLQGTYSCSVADNQPYLTLVVGTEGANQETYRFIISGKTVCTLMVRYLGIEWEGLTTVTTSNVSPDIKMQLQEEITGQIITFKYDATDQIPPVLLN